MFKQPVVAAALLSLLFGPSLIAQTPPRTETLPLSFERNQGQAPTRYSYISHRDGMEIGFLPNGVDLLVPGPSHTSRVVHLVLQGRMAEPEGRNPLAGRTNYFRGSDQSRWISGVADYGSIEYSAIYPGIDLSFYGNGGQLEHDFEVQPGSDPAQIAFRLDGADGVSLTSGGDLDVRIGSGTLTLRKPVAYQSGRGGRSELQASFVLAQDGTVRFRVGHYDTSRTLVIDPVFTFSTYLAGTGTDLINAVTTDASGNIYVTGSTTSTDFPSVSGEPSSSACTSCQNAFVTKLDPTGKTLIYSTLLGGSYQNSGFAIQVDSNGEAIIAGLYTGSTSDFPHAGAIPSPACQTNAQCYFLASLSADGSKLNYSGAIGGMEGDYTNSYNGSLALDTSGDAYLAGITDDSNFQTTAGTLSPTITGYPYNTMFVLKVDPTGKLLYSTGIPGTAPQDPAEVENNFFLPDGISVDANGQVTVSGTAGPGLPTTPGVVTPAFPNNLNSENPTAGFVLQLNAAATALNFASYLPGTDDCHGLAVAPNGNLYFTGYTSETNLPVSSNAYQKTPTVTAYGGYFSGYILELAPVAASTVAATYLDGTQSSAYEASSFSAIALDSTGNVFVGGATGSSDFPLVDPLVTLLETAGSADDALILAEMSSDLSSLKFGSFLSATDGILSGAVFSGLTIDATNQLVVTGTTTAKDFPTTSGSFEPNQPPAASPYSSPQHSFISKINLSIAAPSVCPSSQSVALGTVTANTSSTSTVQVTNCGNAPLTFSALTSSAPTVVASQSCGAIAPGAACPVKLTYTPVDSTAVSGTLTLSDNAAIPTQTLSFSGQGGAPKVVAQPASVGFGHLLVGTQSPATNVFLTNQGNMALAISNTAVTGNGFALVSTQGCKSVQPNLYGACFVEVQFAPQAAGALAGSLTVTSNDPVNPSLVIPLTGIGDFAYAAPTVTSISTQTFQINNGPMPVTVTGTGFYPASVVEIDGVPQATTYQSGTSLQATIAASSLTTLGELPLTVVNPAPGGGTSAPVTITPYQSLLISPSAVVSVASSGMLYAAIPASATSNPNTVLPINPATGAVGTPIPVGKDPVLLAPSADGKYLYVALSIDQSVQRINLQTNAVERTFPYGPNPYCSTCSLGQATDLHVVPGNSEQVVLAQGFVISLYDDTGLISYAPNTYIYYNAPTFDSFAILGSNPMTIYSLPFTTVQNPYFTVATLTSNAISYTSFTGANYGPPNGVGSQVITDGTLLYTSGGEVWNPATATQVGSFSSSTSYAPSITVDGANLYGIGLQTYNSGEAAVLSSWTLGTYAPGPQLAFPQIDYPHMSDLLRWGTDGFAFIAAGANLADQELYLTRSSISGQSSPNPVPNATSLSPASVAAGGAAFTLTVNGTGFATTSVVTLNGSPLPTTFVSGDQLTAAVPASAISAFGTAQIVITSPAPGGGTSSALTLTIGNPVPVLQSVSPVSIVAGSAAFPLTATGTGFVQNSVVNWNGSALPTTYVSSAQLTAAVPASRVTASGTAQVTVVSPAPAGGTSAAAVFTVLGAPAVSLSPAALTFGSVAQGTTSAAQTITLNNSGGSPLTILGIATPSGPFTSTNTCGASVNAGASCQISVTFSPSAAGANQATISVSDNAPGSPQTIALNGTGVAPVIVGAATGSSTSATVASGATATYNLVASASPGFTGTVSFSCSGAPQYATCTVAPSSLTLAAAGTGSFTVTVTTQITQNASMPLRSSPFLAGFGLLALFALPASFGKNLRSRGLRLLVCVFVAGVVLNFSGCGGSNAPRQSTYNTPAGTYSLSATSTANGGTVVTPLTLVVQ